MDRSLKQCSVCKEYRPRLLFISKKGATDGLNPACRPCDSTRRIARRIERGERRADPAPGHKWCSKCSSEKPLSEFYTRQSGSHEGKPYAHCIPCVKAANLVRARARGVAERIEALPDADWRRRVLARFNITAEDYGRMLTRQDGRCPGCGATPEETGRRFSIDHDHSCCPDETSCGHCVRGLLCWRCNLTIGHARDSVTVLQNLATYLADVASSSPYGP